jgi:hypothetical protein
LLRKLGVAEFASESPRSETPKLHSEKPVAVGDSSQSINSLPLPIINGLKNFFVKTIKCKYYKLYKYYFIILEVTKSKSSLKASNKNPIEKWLKKRFREGFVQMKSAFEDIDMNKTNHVMQ